MIAEHTALITNGNKGMPQELKRYRLMFSDLRLSGTIDEIRQMLAFLKEMGCEWKSDGKFYTQRGYKQRRMPRFDYFLKKVRGPERSPIMIND